MLKTSGDLIQPTGNLIHAANQCLLSDHMQVLKKIESGYKNPPPPGCHEAIYQLMTECWLVLPDRCNLILLFGLLQECSMHGKYYFSVYDKYIFT